MTESNHDNVVNFRAHKYQPADLYFDMQHYKKKLRLRFLEDIARMKAEGADTEELMSRLIRHERARKIMRDAFDEVAGNPRSRLSLSYDTLVELCDEYGINEFKERLLLVRPTDGLEPEVKIMNKADEISQVEKLRIMLEELRLRTYHGHATASADEDRGGRFALVQKPATIIGASPISYPALPADSPSNQLAMMPDEPPLGIGINAMEPTGEAWEQEASKATGDAAAPVAKPGWRRF